MASYKCVYRDSKSPLTPIKPMNTQAFQYSTIDSAKSDWTVSTRTLQPTKSYLSPNPTSTKSPVTPSSTRILQPTKTCLSPKPTCRSVDTTGSMSLTKPSGTTRYLTLSPLHQSKTFGKVSTNGSRTIARKVTEEIMYENGEVVKVSRSKQEEISYTPSLRSTSRTLQSFKKASPICGRNLCPKVAAILKINGLEKYKQLFEKEEIDFDVFLMLDNNDLDGLQIYNQRDRDLILQAIRRRNAYSNC